MVDKIIFINKGVGFYQVSNWNDSYEDVRNYLNIRFDGFYSPGVRLWYFWTLHSQKELLDAVELLGYTIHWGSA